MYIWILYTVPTHGTVYSVHNGLLICYIRLYIMFHCSFINTHIARCRVVVFLAIFNIFLYE